MSDQKAKRFTFDEDKTGASVPDIQELLYAKNAKKTKTSKPASSLDPTITLDISKVKLDEVTRQSDVIESPKKSTQSVYSTSTQDANALQNPGEIELGEMEGTLSIDSGTQLPPAPKAAQDATRGVTPPTTPPNRFAKPETGEVVVSHFQKNTTEPAQSGPVPKTEIRKSIYESNPSPVLSHCDLTQLQAHKEQIPFGAGIKVLFDKSKTTSAIVFTKTGNSFTATQVIGAAERAHLWRGMEITQNDLPDLYNRLNKFGYSEFSTLGMSGAGNFERTGFRTAFGVERAEYMTLVKVGAGKEIDAIVAVVSNQSIQTQIPFFHSALMGTSSIAMKKVA